MKTNPFLQFLLAGLILGLAATSLLAEDKLRPVFLFDAVHTHRVQPPEMTSVDPHLYTLRNLNTHEDYLKALSEAGLSPQT